MSTMITTDEQGMTTIERNSISLAHIASDDRLSLVIDGAGCEIEPADLFDLAAVALTADLHCNRAPAQSTPPAPVDPVIQSPRFPQPADFQKQRQIGTIAGTPIYGEASWCEITGKASRYGVSIALGDLKIFTEGAFLSLSGYKDDGCHSLPLWVVGRLLEFNQASGIEQLVKLARHWCDNEIV